MNNADQVTNISIVELLRKEVVELDLVLQEKARFLAHIDGEFSVATVEHTRQKFNDAWLSKLGDLDQLCKLIRSWQPRLNKLSQSSLPLSTNFPEALAFRRLRLNCNGWEGVVPQLVTFPFKKALRVYDSEAGVSLIQQLLLRLLYSLPVTLLDITIIDPMRMGDSMHPFKSLLELRHPFSGRRFLTRTDEIDSALQEHRDYVEGVLQYKFKDRVRNWEDYNVENPSNKLPYKLLVAFGVPAQFSDKSLWTLEQLMEHGPRCGVLPIVSIAESFNHNRPEKLQRICVSLSRDLAGIFDDTLVEMARVSNDGPSTSGQPASNSFISICAEDESTPTDLQFSEIVSFLYGAYENRGCAARSPKEFWIEETMWSSDSVGGLSVPIGWSEDGKPVSIVLGSVGKEHHALLAGRSGSGKSNLLHVFIHSLCHRYSPDEVKLYLLDYKKATEFSLYATPPIPHAALVATESDPDYGVSVLSHICAELETRANQFKSRAVRDIQEYREVTREALPRILLIIDEFQLLFSEGRQVSEPAERLLNELLRQGRAYGIHILLATQTLRGIQSVSMGQLISQIGCRVALACSDEDSALVLGSSNWEASTLSSPPEGILNESNGAKSANRKFNIPFAERLMCASHQEVLHDEAVRQGRLGVTRVFNGAFLPNRPSPDLFQQQLVSSTDLQLRLGEELNFEARPFRVALQKRAGQNLLVAGHNEEINQGLLLSILSSLQALQSSFDVVYFNARGGYSIMEDLTKSEFSRLEINIQDSSWSGELMDEYDDMSRRHKVLIVDGLEYAKMYHGGTPVGLSRKDAAQSPLDSIKKLMEEGPRAGCFMIAFIDNWRRATTTCRDLLPLFDLRVGFCLSEDDAGALISGGIGKCRGLEQGNKAVFSDRLKNQQNWFRPYKIDGL